MKKIELKLPGLIVISLLLSSCNQMLYTSLDILRPAKVAFAPEASNLLLVNNSTPQPAGQGHRTIPYNAAPKRVELPTDSMSLFCLGALTEELGNKDFFTSVKMLPQSLNKSNDPNTITLLNDSTVRALCLSNTANTVLALNNIKVADDLTEYYFNETGSWLIALECRIETNWSVHYLNNMQVTTVHFKDTAYWESESYNRREAYAGLAKRPDALIDAALNAGRKSGDRFVPYWEKADRYFFNPANKQMRAGMDSVYLKNWNAAIRIWGEVANRSKNETTKAQAANNIAIAYEILGNIDRALEYATLSYNIRSKMNNSDFEAYLRARSYVKELSQRKKEIPILKKQLGE
ncbi:MAG TPA: DUF6340 family protein [Paludibacter sp.]|nr:DUF6340 family protein [Paludibacter sp.]